VASALTATWPDETWECSHIGGDRFAANVLVLPDGYCYGRLDATSAPRVVRDHLEGRVDPEHLRGPSTQPPAAQAAIAEAIRRLGAAGPHDLSVLSHRESSPGTWTVRLAGSGSMPALIEARVDRTTGPRAQLTCRATRESAAYVYDVTALEVISSPD
jgi:(2Fe-2S) ferredoxin